MTLKKSLSLKENKCFYIPVDKLNQITRIDKGLQLLHIAEQLKTKLFKHSQGFIISSRSPPTRTSPELLTNKETVSLV